MFAQIRLQSPQTVIWRKSFFTKPMYCFYTPSPTSASIPLLPLGFIYITQPMISGLLLRSSVRFHLLSHTYLKYRTPGLFLQWPRKAILQTLFFLTPYLVLSLYSHLEYPPFLHVSSNARALLQSVKIRIDLHELTARVFWELKHDDHLPVQYATPEGPHRAAVSEVLTQVSALTDPYYWRS